MQGFYRTGENNAAFQSHENGTEQIPVYLQLGSSTTRLHSVYDFSMQDYFNACWSNNWVDFYPDGMESANEAFNRGAYQNRLIFENPEDHAMQTISLYNTNYSYSNWCIFDNFKLEFSGEIVLAEGIEVSIDKPNIIVSETAQCSYTITPENVLINTVT